VNGPPVYAVNPAWSSDDEGERFDHLRGMAASTGKILCERKVASEPEALVPL
jgi:hypothetical protein